MEDTIADLKMRLIACGTRLRPRIQYEYWKRIGK